MQKTDHQELKLYIVTSRRQGMVLASSTKEAMRQIKEIEHWEMPVREVREADGARLDGWDDDTSVYHGGRGIVKLREAEHMARQQPATIKADIADRQQDCDV